MGLRRSFDCEVHLSSVASMMKCLVGGGGEGDSGNSGIPLLHSHGDPKCEIEVLKRCWLPLSPYLVQSSCFLLGFVLEP